MPRTFSKKISQDELWEKVDDVAGGYRSWTCLTPQVEKDLAKVRFDTENIDVSECRTLSNGLSFIGISAGGDWEWPVFFIIYYDGKKLRGYIPRDGNPWNTTTKRAYGNDGEVDNPCNVANAKQRGFLDPDSDCQDIDYAPLKRDMAKIIADIEFRIQYTGK